MLAANDMLEALTKTTACESYQNHNDDADFGDVLDICQDNSLTGNKIRCSDGQERVFSFDL